MREMYEKPKLIDLNRVTRKISKNSPITIDIINTVRYAQLHLHKVDKTAEIIHPFYLPYLTVIKYSGSVIVD